MWRRYLRINWNFHCGAFLEYSTSGNPILLTPCSPDNPYLPHLVPALVVGVSPGGLVVKKPPASAGGERDMDSVLRRGRCAGEGNGNHSSMLAWRLPGTKEPGGLQSMGSQRAGYNRARHAQSPGIFPKSQGKHEDCISELTETSIVGYSQSSIH